jgi:phenylpropionate dioxygenase-like ring-hydroxylating dioxygenase large terminal subunit
MFEGFARVWSPLAPVKALRRGPLRVVLAGEPIVLFQDRAGAIGALIDRCPHRGAALSLGRVGDDGCLECPFHGWRFDVDGSNRRTPLNPQARREGLAAQALPVRRLGDLVWVYTEPGASAPPEPVAPEGLIASGLARTYTQRLWACHWTRAMENMLDSAHVPFVHLRTIGRDARRRMTDASRMDVDWEPTPWGGRARARLDGHDSGAVLTFHRPNIMALHIPIPGRHLHIHALVMPEAAGRTRLVVVGSRDFARWPVLNPIFARMNGRIADEDHAVVESAGPDETPPAASERSVGTDAVTLQFRQYYYETLRGSAV